MTESEDEVEMKWLLCVSCHVWYYMTCVNLDSPPAGYWFCEICV